MSAGKGRGRRGREAVVAAAAIVSVVALVVAGAGYAVRTLARNQTPDAWPIPGERGEHIVVEVLNGTDLPGLARAATLALRRHGIDVVYFGSADGASLDSTRILVRRGGGSNDWRRAAAVAALLGVPEERIGVALDSLRLLDVSVLLGRDAAARLDLDP